MLTAENVTVKHGKTAAVREASFTLRAGSWMMLLGPNGAGKTTLLQAVSGALPFEGAVTVQGKNIKDCKPRRLARMIGVLSQRDELSAAFTARQIVEMGRLARRSFFTPEEGDISSLTEDALRTVGMLEMADRSMNALSGGERQRVYLAQVLCQDPAILMLDEPASHLDLRYQAELYPLIDAWRREKSNRAVISVEHDLSLAMRFADEVLVLQHGETAAYGCPSDVMKPELLRRVWEMDVPEWIDQNYSAWKNPKEEEEKLR